MSVTISTPQQICNSPLNLSSSKQLFSFPKSMRFKGIGKSNCEKFCYDLPPVKEKRSAAVGYGTKYDFTKLGVKTPAPNIYKIEGDFELNQVKKKGFPFGVSRDNMASSGILGGTNKLGPGPGQYEMGTTKSLISFSFRQRTAANDPMNNGTIKKNPGPGQYEPVTSISQKGKYFISKFKNSGATLFNPPRSKRFFMPPKSHEVPGPGNYEIKTGITKEGKYFVSGFNSSKCRTFSHDMRKTLSQGLLQTPGPGAYRLPSEFGHYQSKQSDEAARSVSPKANETTKKDE